MLDLSIYVELRGVEIKKILLTASESIVTKNAQAAQNHCILQIANVASMFNVTPDNKTITDANINTLDTKRSASATLAMNAFPAKIVSFLFVNMRNINVVKFVIDFK